MVLLSKANQRYRKFESTLSRLEALVLDEVFAETLVFGDLSLMRIDSD